MRSARRALSLSDAAAGLGAARVLAATPAAILVRLGEASIWIPRSAVHGVSELRADAVVGAEGRLFVFAWFARARGGFHVKQSAKAGVR